MTFTKKNRQTASGAPADGRPAAPGSLAGDQLAAFNTLFEQYWNRVCGTLFRLVGDWAEAEDLALEAFVRLYRQPPVLDQNAGGWLYRVATNLGLNALRARHRRQRYEEAALSQAIQDEPIADPAVLLEQAQERAQVRETLQRMKPRSAEVLVLRSSGLPYAEIAAALGVAPGSVGTLLARAEREFEQLYQENR